MFIIRISINFYLFINNCSLFFYIIELTEVPAASKIKVIKVVREVTGLGLKEAKELVEAAPKVVKEAAAKADAEELKKKLEEVGAKVTLK